MGKLRIIFLLFNLLAITNCLGGSINLKGKWIAELTSGYILLMDFKSNEVLTLGQIDNSKGSLQIESVNGKWKLENKTLKLQLPDINQVLKIEKLYLDSIVFRLDNSNDISLRKLVPILTTNQNRSLKIENELIGKQMMDNYNNTYLFFIDNKFKYSKPDQENPQNKKWYVFDFEGTELLILGEAEWFVSRIVFIPHKRMGREISFKYYYKNNISNFVLSELKTIK